MALISPYAFFFRAKQRTPGFYIKEPQVTSLFFKVCGFQHTISSYYGYFSDFSTLWDMKLMQLSTRNLPVRRYWEERRSDAQKASCMRRRWWAILFSEHWALDSYTLWFVTVPVSFSDLSLLGSAVLVFLNIKLSLRQVLVLVSKREKNHSLLRIFNRLLSIKVSSSNISWPCMAAPPAPLLYY